MRPLALLLPVALLGAAALTGLRLEGVREEAGIPRSAARVPLGGFEPVAVSLLWLRQEEFLEQRRLSEAVTAIRLVTELQPRVAEGWSLLASILAWQVSESSGDPEEQWRWAKEAIDLLHRGLALNPDAEPILWRLGHIHHQRLSVVLYPELSAVAERELGRPPEAVALEHFRKLTTLDPEYAVYRVRWGEAAYVLGVRLVRSGDRAAAVAALIEARDAWEPLEADPEYEVIREKMPAIRSLLERLRSP
jgi:tetratricopeptide (TPR) repeat protein